MVETVVDLAANRIPPAGGNEKPVEVYKEALLGRLLSSLFCNSR